MKVKKTSEKVLSALYWLVIGFLTVRWLLLGKIDVLTMILLAVAYFYIILKCITCVLNLILKREDYKLHKECKQLFEQLKIMHKARYKAYFSGNDEEIETLSEGIESTGELLITIGEERLKDGKVSKRIRKELIEMIDTTKKLMTTVQS